MLFVLFPLISVQFTESVRILKTVYVIYTIRVDWIVVQTWQAMSEPYTLYMRITLILHDFTRFPAICALHGRFRPTRSPALSYL